MDPGKLRDAYPSPPPPQTPYHIEKSQSFTHDMSKIDKSCRKSCVIRPYQEFLDPTQNIMYITINICKYKLLQLKIPNECH